MYDVHVHVSIRTRGIVLSCFRVLWFVQAQVVPIAYEGVVLVVMVLGERETGTTPTDTDIGVNMRLIMKNSL